MKLFNFLAVFFGGALGASARYAFEVLGMHIFSWSSVACIAGINVLGCFLFGLLSPLLSQNGQSVLILFVFTGFLGAMTTFSTLVVHTYQLLELKHVLLAASNMFLQVVLGLGVFYLAQKLAVRFYG